MLVDVEIMVEMEDQREDREKLEELGVELEGVENEETKKEFKSIPVNTHQIVMLQPMQDDHCLIFFSESFPPVTAKKSKDELKEKINNKIEGMYGKAQ